MALFLTEEDVTKLLPMTECIDVLDRVFAHAREGWGENTPRSRIMLPGGVFHFMSGAATAPGVSGFGYKAYTTFSGRAPKVLVMLYDLDTGELLSVTEARAMGAIRTGAASGLATKYMARSDASTVGVIGSAYHAVTQLEAVCAVRDVKQVRCYSRTRERRTGFASKMAEHLNVEAVAVDSAEECVRGAGILVLITDSVEPVLDGGWLDEGCHINAAGATHWIRRETDDTAVERADLIVVDDLAQAKLECGDLLWPSERGKLRWSRVHELKDVVSGRVAGRPGERSITLFESQGAAIEDVAAAMHVYHKAKDMGVGQELPF